MWEYLDTLRQWEQLSDVDLHFGRLLARLAACDVPELMMAACLVSHGTSNGHVCINLNDLAGRPLFAQAGEPWHAPALASWATTLLASPVVGRPGDFRPLVLDEHGRLYLYRYWQYEQQLADDLRRRAAHDPPDVDAGRLHDSLARLFPPRRSPDCDWQKIATAVAALKHFCVIAGGPGTGKTSTVARVLALLVEQAGMPKPRIGLAAPTGKATARLQEAARHPWYPGRPVMITRNDYHLRLFNGDVGITLPDPEAQGRLRVYFPTADGSMRRLPPFRLPEHETVYAMTVHKSQGSEFEDVLLVLGDEHSPVMTRELLYTGITRARARTAICGIEEAFKAAVGRQLQRSSGLREALWG